MVPVPPRCSGQLVQLCPVEGLPSLGVAMVPVSPRCSGQLVQLCPVEGLPSLGSLHTYGSCATKVQWAACAAVSC